MLRQCGNGYKLTIQKQYNNKNKTQKGLQTVFIDRHEWFYKATDNF